MFSGVWRILTGVAGFLRPGFLGLPPGGTPGPSPCVGPRPAVGMSPPRRHTPRPDEVGPMTNDAIVARLKQSTDGLLFPSETDAPIRPFVLPRPGGAPPSAGDVLSLGGHPPGSPVESVPFDDFFAALAGDDGMDPEQRRTADALVALGETLRSLVAEARVYRVGRRKLAVYVVGVTPAGDLAGVATEAVET